MNSQLAKAIAFCVWFAAVISAISAAEVSSNWPRFGGLDGNFHSPEMGIPQKWTAADVAWRTELGGVGQSSPVIWGDKIFVTTSEQTSDGSVARYVMCLNRADGKVQWRQLASTGPGEELHKMNTWASPTCATDGERVIAYFGPGGLHSFDLDGNKEWSLDGLVKVVGTWGFGSSPVILGDMVVQNCDAQGQSYLLAVNKRTGERIWRAERKETPTGGWSTPILIETAKRKELIVNGEFGVQAYNPATGEELWFCQGFNGRGEPVPAWAHGLLVTVNGKPGDVYAVKPGGSGDVTKTHMAWHTARTGGRDLPSPVVVGDYALAVNMAGVAAMYQATTGKELWRERIGGNYCASPFVAGGLIYQPNDDGEVLVIRPGEKLEIVARNHIGETGDEIFRSSPAPSGGQVFLRSDKAVYCIGGKAAE
jgi:outer membrane protein assembly factor BamB